MKILFVNTASEWGGGEGWTLRSALGLMERGHGVHLAARSGTPMALRSQQAGLPVHTFTIGIDYHPVTIFQFLNLIRKEHFDVVIVHHNKDVRTAAIAAKLAGCPVVHRNGFPILKNNWRHQITVRFVDRILTNSGRIRDTYLGFGWLKTPIDLVYNGIQAVDDNASNSKLHSLLPEWSDNLVALYSGRLTSVKRVDILLRAFSSLPSNSRWRLAIAGAGAEEATLNNLVTTLGLSERVKFLGFREDAPDLAGGADLVVLPSRDEGMPNALMEAMVRGVPVAATPVGDVPELLDDGNAGWIIAVDDSAGWSGLLKKLEQQPDLMRAMADTGYQRVTKKFTFSSMINGIETSLQRAIQARKG